MPALSDPIRDFHDALRGGPLPAGLLVDDGADTQRRFDVYRNNVTVGLTGALTVRFAAVQRLVGPEYFQAIAKVYAQAEPPTSPIIAQWGEGFAAFLDQFPPLAAYPYLGDVARIEFARGQAFHAADGAPIDPAHLLGGGDPGALTLTLHPSVRVLHLSFAAVTIWQRNQPGADPAQAQSPFPVAPQIALILRDPGFGVPVTAISPPDAAMIGGLKQGETLGQAADRAAQLDAAHDPQPILIYLMRCGAICQAKD